MDRELIQQVKDIISQIAEWDEERAIEAMEELKSILEINISDLKDALTSSEYDEFNEYADNYSDKSWVE